MAIIDLGKVSITWRGTYAGGTAYTPKDAVVYNNASYICIANTTGNLPTDTTYWNVMAAKGVDGTDIGTTLTTQGDILYRDGSGLQRLAAGTSGQFLKTQGTGANPVWATNSAVAGSKAFAAFQSGSDMSALNSSANTELVFDGEKHDDDGLYNTSNGRYTPGVAGIYFVSSDITVNDINGAGDDFYLKFLINGDQSAVAYSQTRHGGDGANFTDFHATAVIKLTNNSDYISTWVYQDAGGSRTPKQNLCWFYGFRLA